MNYPAPFSKNQDAFYWRCFDSWFNVAEGGKRGGKNRDERLIKGNTYGTAYITEANECAPTFIQEVFDRTISSPCRRVFHDLNPKAQQHWYYDILKFHEEQQLLDPSYGYNYGHFTIADNMSIPDEQLRQILKTYDKSTVWYARDILGQRKAAEGLIYQTFADNTSDFLIDDPLAWCRENNHRITRLMIGVDFGGTKSATTFVAVGITNKLTVLALDQEWMDSNDLDPDKLNRKFVEFVRRVQEVYGAYGEIQTRADNEESVLIRGIRNAVQRENLRCSVHNAKKMEINNRIKLTLLLMAQKRFYAARRCEHLIDALQTAVYDPKSYEAVRLDDGTSDIDSLDATEYCLEPWYQQLLRYGEKPYQSILGR